MNNKAILKSMDANLSESIGLRSNEHRSVLSPVARSRDVGRRNNRSFGKIDINRVCPDPNQPRVEFDAEALEQLAKSIGEKGQLAPIRVRWSEELSKWLIIAGERRWRACKQAGLSTIDCNFEEHEMTPTQILEEQLVENLLRVDLKPIEEAESYKKLLELNGWNGKQLANALSVSPTRVSRALALLKLDSVTQGKIDRGEISARAGYELSRLPKSKRIQAVEDNLLTANAIKSSAKPRKPRSCKPKQLTFLAESGWKIVATKKVKSSYHELEMALEEALEEVRLRISNRVSM